MRAAAQGHLMNSKRARRKGKCVPAGLKTWPATPKLQNLVQVVSSLGASGFFICKVEAHECGVERGNEYTETCLANGGLVRDVASFFHPVFHL